MHHARPRGAQPLHRDPLPVEGHMAQWRVVGLVDVGEARVAGVLHRIAPVAAEQLHDEVVQHLGPRPHHDLGRVHLHAAHAAQVGREGRAQPRGAGRGRLAHECLLGGLGEHLAHGARPQRVGKEPRGRDGPGEVGDERGLRRGLLPGWFGLLPGRLRGPRAQGGLGRPRGRGESAKRGDAHGVGVVAAALGASGCSPRPRAGHRRPRP